MNFKLFVRKFFFLICLLVLNTVFASSFIDTSFSDFSLGSLNRLTVGADGNVSLSLATSTTYQTDGNFVSRIFDSLSNSTSWNGFTFNTPLKYGQLPNGGCASQDPNDINMCGNILLYHLDETSGAIIDYSGNGKNGVATGLVNSTNCKLGTCYTFSGSNSYIDTTINIPATVTISAWARSTAPESRADMLWCFNNAGTGGPDLFFNTNNIYLNTWDSAGNLLCAQPDASVWRQYTTVIDAVANNAKLYIDGVLCGTGGYRNPTKASFAVSSSNGYDWEGQIDEVAIWNRALTPTEILNLYKKTVVLFKAQVTSCAESNCSDANFVGPDGTNSTFFNDSNIALDLGMIANNRYFRYKANFETDDTNVLKGTTPVLLDTNTNYTILNYAPDINIYKIEDYSDDVGLPAFSYFRDGALTIDFNVLDTENNRLFLDINYSSTNTEGSGTPIVEDFNLTSLNCSSTTWNIDSVDCNYDWDISLIPDGNYFILIKVSDGSLTKFQATDNSFMIDNTNPSTSWNGISTWQKNDSNIQLTCTDASSGCAITKHRLDVDPSNDILFGDWQTYSNNILINGDGNWAIDFNSTDNAENQEITNEFFILTGPHGRLTTYKNDLPRSFFGGGETITLRLDANFPIIPSITITNPLEIIIIDNNEMIGVGQLYNEFADVNSFDFNFTLPSTIGWYDVIIGAELFEKAFYVGEVWNDTHISPQSEVFPYSIAVTVTEPNTLQRWFSLIDQSISFTYGANASSIRVLDFNGTNYTEIPSQIHQISTNGSFVSSANIVFLVSLDKNETRNFFITYASSEYGKIYSSDLNTIQSGFIFDFNNSFYKTIIDINKGGAVIKAKNNFGSGIDFNSNPIMFFSPQVFTDPVTYSASSLANPTFSQSTQGNLISKINTKGTVGAMDYNLEYTFYAKTPYFLVDTNIASKQSGFWDYYADSFFYIKNSLFSKFASSVDDIISTSDVNQSNTIHTINDSNFVGFYNSRTKDSFGEIFISREFTKSSSISTMFRDLSSNSYLRKTAYSGNVEQGDLFNSKKAVVFFNPWNDVTDINSIFIQLSNQLQFVSGVTSVVDSNAPRLISMSYSPADLNDATDVNCFSIWEDDLLLNYVDVNIYAPDWNYYKRQSVLSSSFTASYLISAENLSAGDVNCIFTAVNVAGRSDQNSVLFNVSDVTAPYFHSVTNSPDSNALIDPGTIVTVDANILEYSGVSSVTLFTRYLDSNSVWSDWNAVTMNFEKKYSDYNYYYSASFTTSSSEDQVWQYKINAIDVNGSDANTLPVTIYSYVDWDWSLVPSSFVAATGLLGEEIILGDLNISNTGDRVLNFRIFSNWDNKNQISYGGNVETSSGYSFVLGVGESASLEVSLTAKTIERSDSLSITVDAVDVLANPSNNSVTSTVISLANGPFLLIEWESYAITAKQGDNDLKYIAKITNKGNSDANEIEMDWNLPSGWGIVQGNQNSRLGGNLVVNNSTTNELTVFVPSSATLGTQSVIFNVSCCNDINKTKSSSVSTIITDSTGSTGDSNPVGSSGGLSGAGGGSGGDGGSGGGLPFSSQAQRDLFFQTSEFFELVRGQDSSFRINFRNPLDRNLVDLRLSVSGISSNYLVLKNDFIPLLDVNKEFLTVVEIGSPKYFSPGVYEIIFIISGRIQLGVSSFADFEEKRVINLLIHDTNKDTAKFYLEEMEVFIGDLVAGGYQLNNSVVFFNEAKKLFEKRDFDGVKEKYLLVKDNYDSLFQAIAESRKVSGLAGLAKSQGIETPSTNRLFVLAKLAVQRGDYALALDRLKEAELTYSLETKGEFNLFVWVLGNFEKVVVMSVLFVLALFLFVKGFSLLLINRGLREYNSENGLLLDMIADLQRKSFVENKMSLSEYYDSLTQFETRIAVVSEKIIELMTKKNNLFSTTSKSTRLRKEKLSLTVLLKDLQLQYFNKGLVETRIYQTRVGSISKRLLEVDEALVKDDLKKMIRLNSKGVSKYFWKLFYTIFK